MAHESLGGPVPEPEPKPEPRPVLGSRVVVSSRRAGKSAALDRWIGSLGDVSIAGEKPLFDPEALVGKKFTMELPIDHIDKEVMDIMTGGLLSTPRTPAVPQVFIDGKLLEGVARIEGKTVDGEQRVEIERDTFRFRERIPDVEPIDPSALVEALGPVFDVGEAIKKELAERGWTYEAAEEVAVNYVNASIEKGING